MVQAWSMGTARRMKASKSTSNLSPGPGAYGGNYKNLKKKSPTWKLGSDSRKGLQNSSQTPGPGSYQPDDKKKGPTYVMGLKTQVDFSYLKTTPGPGNYLSSTNLLGEKNKGYSFGGKHQFSNTGKNFPGPGSYNIKSSVKTKERGKSFGRDPKDRSASKDKYLRSVPGPGSYVNTAELLKAAAPKYGFGSQKKSGLSSTNATPGPGTYDQRVHGRNAPRGVM